MPPKLKDKTVATDGKTQTISGWKKPPEGYTDVKPEKVIDRSKEIGHELRSGGAYDHGTSGKYNASHAEKKVLTESSKANKIEVSRETCSDCKVFISQEAQKRGEAITVKDPTGTKVYKPDGSILDVKPSK